MIIVGLVITAASGYFSFKQFNIIQQGDLVDGKVTQIIETQGDDGPMYKPELSYLWKGQEQTYRPSYSSSSNNYRVGQTKALRVSDQGVTFDGYHQGLIPLAMGLVFGIIFLTVGIVWFKRHIHRYDTAIRLKRYGRRVHARFFRKDTTRYTINNQSGTIIYLQEEGGERMFQTHPIFSEFSIKWLEEHIFDVYVDTANPDEYYVDMEKHFGQPEPHK